MSYPRSDEPKPVVEVNSDGTPDRYGRFIFDVRIPEVMMQKRKVGNVNVARWLADELQGWLDV